MTYARFVAWEGDFPKLGNKADQFQVHVDVAIDELLDEAERLGADEVLIESGFTPSSFTRSGRPPQRGIPDHPGIRVAFTGKNGALVFECGTYTRWAANIRAVGLTLTALRAIDRYGAATGQQYTGWKAIENSAEDPRNVLIRLGNLAGQPAGLTNKQLYEAAIKRVHPDVGGSAEDWAAANDAKRSLIASGRWDAGVRA